MAEILVEPVLSFLLERISKLIEEGEFLLGVSDKAQQLQSKLRLMLSLLKVADQRKDEDARLKEWVLQSKDLAYEAENVLESFAFRNAASRNVLERCMCIFNDCYIQHKVGIEIENIITQISNLSRSFQEYGIEEILRQEGSSSGPQQLPRRTYSHVEEDDFIGLEDDVKLLARALVNEHEVVSICGMGGLGKTTIARKIYNHPDVKRHFDNLAWVCISQQWQTRDIWERILLKLIPDRRDEIQKWDLDNLVRELHQVQQTKKCLIVLDDIWSSTAWDSLKDAFPSRAAGSKILLTTRNKNVAIQIAPNGLHHEPRLLSNDESWELLQKKALRNGNFQGFGDIQKFEDLGREMVKNCRGLPLAVVVLGGILATKHDYSEWDFVRQNIKFYLRKGESIEKDAGDVQMILALSYIDLPYKLKPCFLYLGTYPEDWEIETETLYQLWMAEGMVSEADRIGDESLMDTAERYLGELAKRSMVQVKVKEGPGIRSFGSCRLHDLMRDLCLRLGGEENFLKLIDYRSTNHTESAESGTSSSTGNIQRLAIYLSPEDVSNHPPPGKKMARHLRSFTYTVQSSRSYRGGGPSTTTRLKNFKMLRALTIENLDCFFPEDCKDCLLGLLGGKFDLPMSNLVHLRYISLRESSILGLGSISKLQHLETLDLRGTDIVYWKTKYVHRLTNLRHLYLPWEVVYKCCKLRLAGLTNLEILRGFDPEFCFLEDLDKLTKLQVLDACVDKDNAVVMIQCILNLPRLKQLVISVSHWKNSPELTEQLFRCTNLRHLSLWGLLRMLPEHRTHFLTSLIELELISTGLERDPMETLEKLPNLRRLWLNESSFSGDEMTCKATGFPKLTFLSFRRLEFLENWVVEEGALPSLSRLQISNCLRLNRIPDGLVFIATLKELVIVGMPPEFDDRIRVTDGHEGEDFNKVRHVPFLIIR